MITMMVLDNSDYHYIRSMKSKFLYFETLHAFRFQTHSNKQLSHSQFKEQQTTTISRSYINFHYLCVLITKFFDFQRLLVVKKEIPFQQGKAESFEWSGIFVNFTMLRDCLITYIHNMSIFV